MEKHKESLPIYKGEIYLENHCGTYTSQSLNKQYDRYISEKIKRLEYNLAAFGISGLETSFALCYTAMVKSGLMTVDELIKCMTVRPSEILGLNKRGICKGAQADLTIAD